MMRTIGYTIFQNGAGINTVPTIEAAREQLLARLSPVGTDALRPNAFWPLYETAHIERMDWDADAPDGRRSVFTRVETLLERAR